MVIVPFQAEHLFQVRVQRADAFVAEIISPEAAVAMEQHVAFSALDGGTVLGCAGVVSPWTGRGMMWALFSEEIGAHWIAVHWFARRFVRDCGIRRLEATVAVEFEPGHRWVRQLGFEREIERMECYLPTGGAASLYSRVAA